MNERDALQAELDTINSKEQPTQEELSRRKRIMNRLAEIELEEGQKQEAEERQQEQKQHMDSLTEYVRNLGLFEATVGEQEDSGIGLTEYGEKRQLFNQTLYAVVTELQKGLIEKYNATIEAKDATILQLGVKAREAETAITQLKAQNQDLEAKLTQKDEAIAIEVARAEKAEADVQRLQTELEEARKTPAIELPSGNVNEMIEALRQKAKEESDERTKRELANQNIKVTLKERNDPTGREYRVILAETGEEKLIPGFTEKRYTLVSEEEAARFRAEQAAKVEASAESNPTLVETPPIPQFQVPTNEHEGVHGVQPATGSGDIGGDGEATENVSLESLAKRVTELERAVYGKTPKEQGAA